MVRVLTLPPFDAALLHVIATQTANGVMICGTDRLVLWVNAGFTRLTGYTSAEVLGRHPGILLQGPETDPRTIQDVRTALNAERSCTVEIRNYRKNGTPFWNHLEIHPVRDADGVLSCYIAVQTDISPSKQALESLSIHGERLESALSIGDTAVWEWDLDRGSVWSSQRAKTMLGYQPESFLDTVETWEELIHPDEREAVERAVQLHLRGDSPLYRQEYRVLHRDGSWRWILDQGRIVDIENGRPLRMVGTHTDITERRQAATALTTVEARLQKVAAQAPGMLFQFLLHPDGTGSFPYVSQGIRAIYGIAPEEVVASWDALNERLHPEDRTRVMASLAEAGRQLIRWDCDYRIVLRDGRSRWVHAQSDPEQQTDGSLLWHGYISDISERKFVEENLRQALYDAEQATRSKSAFLATMSHEIRTPLNGVIGMVELMGMSDLPTEYREHVSTIHASANNLLQILNDILDYSKLEEGAALVEQVEFAPRALADDALRVVHLKAKEKGLEMHFTPAADMPSRLSGDPSKLRQILFNLLGNAVKFTDQGTVSLSMGVESDGRLTMTVSDSGIGMDAAAISRLFQPFSQADSSMSRRYGGSGLGLAISKRLAELMGGTLDVVSTPGAGSCFTCRVPVRVIIEAPPAPAPAKPATRPLRWSGAVLVIEDNAVNQEVARAMLSRLGLTVTVANDGQSALERVNGASFDLIFMDCQMPVMDGLEATRRLRAQDYRKPIVAMTANALPSDRQACLAAGMDDYLAKPITIDRLKKTLVQFLGSPNSG